MTAFFENLNELVVVAQTEPERLILERLTNLKPKVEDSGKPVMGIRLSFSDPSTKN